MRAKLLLIVVLIGVITGLLVVMPGTNNLFKGTEILPGLSSLLTFGPKEYFQLQFVANRDAYLTRTFDISNTTLYMNGICIGTVYVFGASIAKDGRCEITLEEVNGKVEYSSIGTIEVTVEAKVANADGSLILPANDRRVRVSLAPNEVFISNYNTNFLSVPAANGDIRKFKPDGAVDQTKTLISEKVEITNYIGSVRLIGNDMVLNGVATKVNWFG